MQEPVAGPDPARLLYRVPEAMAVLSLSRTVIYELLRSGRLRSVHEGRTRLILRSVQRCGGSRASGLVLTDGPEAGIPNGSSRKRLDDRRVTASNGVPAQDADAGARRHRYHLRILHLVHRGPPDLTHCLGD